MRLTFSALKNPPFPDIESDRDQYDILTGYMQPSDIALFNCRIIHEGAGNLAVGRDLRVFNTPWAGDDGRVIFRPQGMDPDHSKMMAELGLKPSDPLSGEL